MGERMFRNLIWWGDDNYDGSGEVDTCALVIALVVICCSHHGDKGGPHTSFKLRLMTLKLSLSSKQRSNEFKT